MADQSSRIERSTEPSVDETLKRRLREAYLNDEADALVVTGVRSEGDEAVVEMRTPHGEATHRERFHAPENGSLTECAELLAFLDAVGVSPLDLDELVGKRVPARFDPDTGWRIDEAYRPETASGGSRVTLEWRRVLGRLRQPVRWARRHSLWLVAVLFVGGELLLAAVLVLLFA
jgi:hypothetical protein